MLTASNLAFYFILFTGLYFQIFMLTTLFEDDGDNKKDDNRSDDELPTVAVTIPCFNEGRTLEGTVRSLLALDYPRNKLSIVVVDDGSTDNTYEVATRLNKEFPQVKVFRQANSGKYKALNFGLEQTKSELVSCLDADSFVDKMALRKMVAYFLHDEKIMAVTPAVRVHNPKTILELIQKAEYNGGIFLKQILSKINGIHVTPGPFSVFRRKVFETLGNYRHAHNTEDMEIALRMQAHHYRIVNCPDAFVYTVTPKTVKRLYRQRVRWISGFLKNSIDYKFLYFNRKYGTVSTFTLPFALLFIFTSLYVVGFGIYTFVNQMIERIVRIRTIGFNFEFNAPSFDWFFYNIETISIIGILLFTTSLFFMLRGKKMAEGTMKPGREIVYFIALYGFIAPFWLGKALCSTILSRKEPWR